MREEMLYEVRLQIVDREIKTPFHNVIKVQTSWRKRLREKLGV
jgi:hypothetical protein